MSVPYFENCPHNEDGWCLDCISELGRKLIEKGFNPFDDELTELEETKLLLTAQKAQTDRHKELLLDILGVIVTCRKNNQDEWMHGIVNDINKTLAAIGDDDRFEWNKHQDIIRRVRVGGLGAENERKGE